MKYSKNLLPITDVCLNVTEACNCSCVYCFAEHHPHHMPFKVAKDAADWLYDNALLSSKIQNKKVIPTIGFFGGEPTVVWDDVIVPLVEYNKSLNREFNYGITSNCVLLDKQKVDYLYDNDIGLLISHDGDKETQDYNRPLKNGLSSFDIIEKNIKYIQEKFPNSTFRSTIIPETAHNLFKNLSYAGQLGFENVFAIINEFCEWNEEHRKIVEEEIDKYCLYVIDCCMKEKPFVKLRPFEQAINKIIGINISYIYMNEEERESVTNIGPDKEHRCGLGSGYGSINYKGDIFSCQEVASRSGEKEIFYIGNIYEGIDEEKLNNLRETFFNKNRAYNIEKPEKCKDCILSVSCDANYCQVNSYILYQNFEHIPDCWCWWNNLMYEKAFMVLQILGANENKFFKDYLLKEVQLQGGPLAWDIQ